MRQALHKKWSFPLRISSVNVTKSAENCGFGHMYWRNHQWKTWFLCSEVHLKQFPNLKPWGHDAVSSCACIATLHVRVKLHRVWSKNDQQPANTITSILKSGQILPYSSFPESFLTDSFWKLQNICDKFCNLVQWALLRKLKTVSSDLWMQSWRLTV